MDSVLVYSDSLTWGIIPNTRNRLPFDERWPGVLENALNARGLRVRMIEDCLNGRRTVWEDPFKPGRNGLQGLAQRIEIHSPLSLVILMLGTNDLPVPPVLVVSPPPIHAPKGPIAPKFLGAENRCAGLTEAYREVSSNLGCQFFDAGSVTPASQVDGIQLDADQHEILGQNRHS